MCLPRRQFDWEVDLPESGRDLPSNSRCGQQQPIFRKVVEIYGDLQRFARLRWTLPSTQYVCVEQHRKYVGRPKSGLCTMIMRQWGNHLRTSEQVCNSRDTIWWYDVQHYLIRMSSRMVSPGFRRPTPTATAASDIFTRRQADVVRASRCIFLSVCFADVVPWRLGLILSVGRRAYRLYGVSPAAGRTPPGILNQASTRTRLSAQTHKETLEKVSRNRNFRNIFPDSRGSNHYQYQILSFKWKD